MDVFSFRFGRPGEGDSRRKISFIAPLVVVLVLTLPATALGIPLRGVTTYGPDGTPCAADHILVKFRPGTPASEVARAHAAARSVILDGIPQIGVQIVGLAPGLSVGPAIGFYQHNPNVEFAEPDYLVAPALTPNDPYFHYCQLGLQWMGAEQAWDITTGSPSLLIAVLDSGVDFTHPDLRGRLVAGWDFWDNDADPTDTYGHGTAVTGVLGAVTNNGLGIAAVSWRNPVLCVRIGDLETTSGLIAKGVTYAADRGARAINISSAGPSYSSSEASAVDYAWNKGAVVVAAAGNSGTSTPQYPAALPRVVAVSGVDDVLVSYSNYGSWIDVCAPCNSQTTSLGGWISLVGGTSISAPFVTGLFGLVFSVNPALTPQQAVDIVTETATDLGDPGFDIYYGWGKINIYQAVLAASQSVPPADNTAPAVNITTPTSGALLSGTTAVIASASDNVSVARVDLYLDGSPAGSLTSPPYEWAWDTTKSANGTHGLHARAFDAVGNEGVSSAVSVNVQNAADPPVMTETFTGSVGFKGGATSRSYTVAVGAAGSISASLTWGGRADLDLYLYSSTGALLTSSTTRSRSGPEQINYQVASAGAYTLKVAAASGKANYTLTATYP